MRNLFFAFLLMAVACGSETEPGAKPSSTSTGGDDACPDGFTPADGDDDATCVPLLPEGACAPGSMAIPGNAECLPVGWQASECPAGFVADASGWGCTDVLPPEPCKGATIDRLGESACVPIGDCNAPFPPADATHFVDASYSDAMLDAKHFRVLAEALSKAPAGAVVAIEAGTYPENLLNWRAARIVGRCAEQVRIEGGLSQYPGFEVSIAGDIDLTGVTISGYASGVSVFGKGVAKLHSVVLEDNLYEGLVVYSGGQATLEGSVVRGTVPGKPGAQTEGVLVYGKGRLTIEASAIVDNEDSGVGLIDAGTEVHISRSVVRHTIPRADGVGGSGLKAFDGSMLTVDGSAIIASRGLAVFIDGPGVIGNITTSIVRDTVVDDRFDDEVAWALTARRGAALTITDSALAHNPVVGLSGVDSETTVTAERLVVRDMLPGGIDGLGAAVTLARGVPLFLGHSAIVGARSCAILSNDQGSLAIIEDSAVVGTLPAGGELEGRGGSALGVVDGARAEVRRSSIVGNAEVGLGAVGEGVSLVVEGSLIDVTAVNAGGLFGHGFVVKGGAHASVTASVVRASAGIGLAFAGATGLIAASFIEQNAVGIHVQDGAMLLEQSATDPNPLEVIVTPDTLFVGNATRVGSGTVALPDLVEAPPSDAP